MIAVSRLVVAFACLQVFVTSVRAQDAAGNYADATAQFQEKEKLRKAAAAQPVTLADFENLRSEVTLMKAQIARLQEELATLKTHSVEQPAAAPRTTAARAKKLKVWPGTGAGNPLEYIEPGMTIEEAAKVFETKPMLLSQNGSSRTYRIPVHGLGGASIVAEVVNQKITSSSLQEGAGGTDPGVDAARGLERK